MASSKDWLSHPRGAVGCEPFRTAGGLKICSTATRERLLNRLRKGHSGRGDKVGKSFTAMLLSVLCISAANAENLGPRAKLSGMDPIYGSTRGQNCVAGQCGPRRAGRMGQMSCSSLAQICQRRNANSPACQTSRANCMSTGVFVGPQGATFSGVRRQ